MVLESNTDYAILSLGQRCRDRADVENAFDEYEESVELGGAPPTTCTVARAVALVYNW